MPIESKPPRAALPPGGRGAVVRFAGLLAAIFAVWTVRATWLARFDTVVPAGTLRTGWSIALKVLLWVLPAAWFVRRSHGVPVDGYFGWRRLPSRATWWRCLVITGAFLGVVLALEVMGRGRSLSVAEFAARPWAPALLFFLGTPLVEEVFFRGFVLRELLDWLSPWRANALASGLFVGIHLPYWIYHGGIGPDLLADAAGVFCFSLIAGWLFVLSRSIWPPTLAHVGNNVLASLLAAPGG